MPQDFETFEKISDKYKNKKNDNSDLIGMITELIGKVNFKIAIFLFILSIIIFSDSFVELFLQDIPGAVDDTDNPTSKGTIIQLMFQTFGYIIIDLLINSDIL